MTPVKVIIVVTVVHIIAGWLLIGKHFNGNEKEDRICKWQFRLLIVATGCMTIGANLKKDQGALLVGFMILAILVIGIGLSNTD